MLPPSFSVFSFTVFRPSAGKAAISLNWLFISWDSLLLGNFIGIGGEEEVRREQRERSDFS